MQKLTKVLILLLLPAVLLSCSKAEQTIPQPDLTQYVDPYIGTGYHGHVFLGANVPFGAVQPGPTNYVKGWDWCSGYHYSDSIVVYAPIKLLFHFLIYNEWIKVIDLAIESLIFTTAFTFFQGLVLYHTIKPKLSFLESDLPFEKRFGHIEEKENINAEKFDIARFIKSLENDFIVTYKSNTTIKVRDKIRIFKNNSGAAIYIDKAHNQLKIYAFPLIGGYKKGIKNAGKMVKKIKAKV